MRTVTLIERLLQESDLVEKVRTLDPPTLTKMIEETGLEDAGSIVALATTEQLQGIFDRDLWKNSRPGEEEKFDAVRFATWLEVLVGMGVDAAAEKLVDMDPDFLTFALSERVLVLNFDRMTLQYSENDDREDLEAIEKQLQYSLTHQFDEFCIVSRDLEGWPALVALLCALDTNHQDFLRPLLERLEYITNEYVEDNGGLYDVLSAAEQIASDAAGDREKRLEEEGYVPPLTAKAFLDGADRAPEVPRAAGSTKTDLTAPVDWRVRLKQLGLSNKKLFDQRVAEIAQLANTLVSGYAPAEGERLGTAEAAQLAMQTIATGLEILGGDVDDLLVKRSLLDVFKVGWRQRPRS